MYKIKQINEYTWLIGEDIREDFTDTMILVTGKEKAALIDTGCGIGNLRKVAAGITKLPVIVLTTHVHLDHVGAHSLFEEVYASTLEMEEWIRSGQQENFLEERLKFLHSAVEGNEEKFQEIRKNIVKENHFSWKPLEDEMVFDLGQVTLEACLVPGHTKESFVFTDRKSGNAFAGDSINPNPWIFKENGVGVLEYEKAVRRFAGRYPEVRHLYSGHCMEDIGICTITDTLDCINEVAAGADDPVIECYAGKVFQHSKNCVTMFYTEKFAD